MPGDERKPHVIDAAQLLHHLDEIYPTNLRRRDCREASAELPIALGGFGKGEFVGRGLEVFFEEGGVVSVARGVDADAAACRPLRSGGGVGYPTALAASIL